MDNISILKDEVRALVNTHNKNVTECVGYNNSEACKQMFEDIIAKYKEIDKLYQINLYKRKANILFNHTMKMIDDNPKYIASAGCSQNLELYFKWINLIGELKK